MFYLEVGFLHMQSESFYGFGGALERIPPSWTGLQLFHGVKPKEIHWHTKIFLVKVSVLNRDGIAYDINFNSTNKVPNFNTP